MSLVVTAAANSGYLQNFASSYATAYASANSAGAYSAGALGVGQGHVGSTEWDVWEIALEFDTSSISVGQTIDSVDLELYITDDFSTAADFDIEAYAYDFGASIDTGDWRTPTQLSALTIAASLTTAGIATGAYVKLTANGSNLVNAIVKGGTTRFILASSRLRQAIDPGSPAPKNEWVNVDMQTNKPRLSVRWATTVTKDVASNASIGVTATKTAASDAAISTTDTADVPSAAALAAPATADVLTSALIARLVSADVASDSALSRFESKDVASDAAIQLLLALAVVNSAAAISRLESIDAATDAGIGFLHQQDVASEASILMQWARTADVPSAACIGTNLTGRARQRRAGTAAGRMMRAGSARALREGDAA